MSSTSRCGGSDLDFRPPMVDREALWMKVSMCSECGFAALNISEMKVNAAEHVRSEFYRDILKPGGEATLSSVFSAAAFLAAQAEQHAEAGWLHVYAAWASDDRNADFDAIAARESATECFDQAKAVKQQFCGDEAAERLMLIDLSRRSRNFFDAQRLCHDFRQSKNPEMVRRLIEFQESLITAKDDLCHAMSECPQEETDS